MRIPEIENCEPAERRGQGMCLSRRLGGLSEFADNRPGDRDFSGSRYTLHPPSWCLWPGRQRQRRLYGFLPLIKDHRVGLRYRPRDEIPNGTWKVSGGAAVEVDAAQGKIRAYTQSHVAQPVVLLPF